MTDAGPDGAFPPGEPRQSGANVQPGQLASSPAGRLYRSRYLLAASAAALIIPALLWEAPPLPYAFAALFFLSAVAAFARDGARPAEPIPEAAHTALPDGSMQAVLEAFPQAGFIVDGDGIVRYANGRAAELFPATREGDPFTLTFRLPEVAEALRQAESGEPSSLDFHPPGERNNHYSVSLSPIKYLPGLRNFVLVTFDDVSERMAVVRMRADFVANASHELRTPLASLTGFIETLLGPARDDPHATDKFLKIMLEQARRMRRLIDDLLSLSRVEMRVHHRPTERVDLGGLLDHVMATLGPLGRDHAVVLELTAPQPAVVVIGDRDELVQVFQNLIENAIRYGGSGGRVEVSVEPGERTIAVHVQDFGAGIAPEHLPRLTERFYRVDAGPSRDIKGTGLGLAIVKHILARHGGALAIQSKPGEGARFTVELPVPPVLVAVDRTRDPPAS